MQVLINMQRSLTMSQIKLNPDVEEQTKATEAVIRNNGYCPCALVKTEDTRCICANFLKEVNNGYKGKCECGRYVSV